jgi:hypothetical protein
MLAPEKSPLHCLIFPWWQARQTPPPLRSAQSLREALFTAALQEIFAHHRAGQAYCPTLDHRFKWAVQLLETTEGTRRHPDPDIEFSASLLLDPTPLLSRKDFAAGAA